MGTAKRERQKAGRQQARERAVAEAKVAKRKRAVRNYVLYGVVVLAVAAGLFIYYGGDDDDSNVDTANTSTTLPTGSTVKKPFTYGTTECPPVAGASAQTRTFNAPFKQCIDPAKSYTALIKTNKGDLKVKLDPARAPGTVNNFVALALNKYFDGLGCHRILTDFVAQCGDPAGTGAGGPGYKIDDELPEAGQYKLGSLAMANSGPNTNGSQFFIITGDKGAALPPNYSLFGEVVEGTDTVLKAINAAGADADPSPPKEKITIESVTITVG